MTIGYDSVQERRKRYRYRTLLSLEILQNLTALRVFRAALDQALGHEDSRIAAVAILVTAVTPEWQMARWNMPEAGEHLTKSELMRIGEWQYKLGGLTFLYQRLMEQMRHLPTSENALNISIADGDAAVEQTRSIIDTAKELEANPPPLPDEKLDRGEGILDYLLDLRQRLSKATGSSNMSA